MVVKIPKDIEATEAKMMFGMSLKQLGFAALSGAFLMLGIFALHLPPFLVAVPSGFILFLGSYKKCGMSATTLLSRVISSYVKEQQYYREPLVHTTVRSPEEMQKSAKAWNKELVRQKKKHPNMQVVKAVRCESTNKSRK